MNSRISPRLKKSVKYILVRQRFQLFECVFLMILEFKCLLSQRSRSGSLWYLGGDGLLFLISSLNQPFLSSAAQGSCDLEWADTAWWIQLI